MTTATAPVVPALTPDHLSNLRRSFDAFRPFAWEVAEEFVRRFRQKSSTLPACIEIESHATLRFFRLLNLSVVHASHLDRFAALLRHQAIGKMPCRLSYAHLYAAGEALQSTLAEVLGDDFDVDVRTAWLRVWAALGAALLAASVVELKSDEVESYALPHAA